MALKIVYENKESAGPMIKIDRRLFLNAEGRLVEAGNPGACALYCSPGKRVPRADFEAHGGIVHVEAEVAEAKADAEAAEKKKPALKPKAKPRVAERIVTKKKATKKKATKKKVTKKKRS